MLAVLQQQQLAEVLWYNTRTDWQLRYRYLKWKNKARELLGHDSIDKNLRLKQKSAHYHPA
jgi:hypothetical protein